MKHLNKLLQLFKINQKVIILLSQNKSKKKNKEKLAEEFQGECLGENT